MVDKKQPRRPARPPTSQPPAKQRRVGPASSSNTRAAAPSPSVGLASNSSTIRPLSRKAKRQGIDVFEASDDDEFERKMLARRSGGGASNRNMDDVEDFEYHVDTIEEEDDEEIDEDEAFGDSDEEKYGAFFDGERKTGRAGVNESEDDDGEDEDEDEDGEGFMDISDMLGGSEPSEAPKRKPVDDPTFHKLLPRQAQDEDFMYGVDEQLESDDDEDDEDGDEAGSGPQLSLTSDAEEAAADQLSSYVLALDGKSGRNKRKRAVDRTEVYNESEYNLSARRAGTDDDDEDADVVGEDLNAVPRARQTIGLDALMGSLGDQTGFAGLKKQVAALAKAKGKTATVDAPLPKRIQDRLERQAAYEETKKDISKWQPLVKKNREAEHLKFPMNEPAAINVSSGALVGKFEATTDMEAEIKKLLQDSALLEKSQAKMEELELNKISKEEVLARRAELAKMRSLLFFKEQKQKKVAKIKSKSYRKLHKSSKDDADADAAAQMSIEELKRLDPEAARAEIEKRETARARARMTQKHDGKDKWTKKMLGKNDSETHASQMEKVQRGQELRKAVTGRDSDEDSDDSGDENADVSSEALGEQLDGVDKEIDEAYEGAVNEKGIFAMKFMQRGAEKSRKEARDMVQHARNGLRDDYRSSDEEDGNAGEETAGTAVAGNAGRLTFDGKPKRSNADYDDDSEVEDVDGFSVRVANPIQVAAASMKSVFPAVSFKLEEDVADEAYVGAANRRTIADRVDKSDVVPAPQPATPVVQTPQLPDGAKKKTARFHDQAAEDADSSAAEEPTARPRPPRRGKGAAQASEENPWLAGADEAKAVKRRVTESGLQDAASSSVGKAEKAIEKLAQQKRAARRAEHDAAVADVELNMDGLRALETLERVVADAEPELEQQSAKQQPQQQSAPAPASGKKRKEKKKPASVALPAYEPSDADSDFDPTGDLVHAAAAPSQQRLTQRDIMAMAFANDDVAADFAAEKAAEEERDAPKEVDLTLPGWGSWGGIGIAKKTGKVVKKPKKGDGVEVDKRKDSKLKHVIINERRMKKAVKYTASRIPHGFDTREQYERTIRAPLGREWNAAGAHTDMIKPRVQTKLGVVIAPLKFTGSSGGKKAGKGGKAK